MPDPGGLLFVIAPYVLLVIRTAYFAFPNVKAHRLS